MTASHDEPGDLPGTPSGAAPRMARYGEGPEGRAARRERGLDEHPRDGFFDRTGNFVRDVRAELGRTSWPSALQVRNTTIITIIAVIFFAAYLFAVDQLFSKSLEWLARLFGAAA
ncbi:MAG TPA: preprotein translocase subunit SecE [Pyrinomonadaceae bacterium]|jgi:preprotein translocase SecE subunit